MHSPLEHEQLSMMERSEEILFILWADNDVSGGDEAREEDAGRSSAGYSVWALKPGTKHEEFSVVVDSDTLETLPSMSVLPSQRLCSMEQT